MGKKKVTVDLYDLSKRFSGDTTILEGDNLSFDEKYEKIQQSKVAVSVRPDIISSDSIIEPDGFAAIKFRNIGQCDCKVFDVIPVNPSDPEIEIKVDIFCKIVDKIRVTFTGVSTDKKLLIIKIYLDILPS